VVITSLVQEGGGGEKCAARGPTEWLLASGRKKGEGEKEGGKRQKSGPRGGGRANRTTNVCAIWKKKGGGGVREKRCTPPPLPPSEKREGSGRKEGKPHPSPFALSPPWRKKVFQRGEKETVRLNLLRHLKPRPERGKKEVEKKGKKVKGSPTYPLPISTPNTFLKGKERKEKKRRENRPPPPALMPTRAIGEKENSQREERTHINTSLPLPH